MKCSGSLTLSPSCVFAFFVRMILRSRLSVLREVLSRKFLLSQHLSPCSKLDEQFPFSFEFNHLCFTSSFLEPLFSPAPRPHIPYPFETQLEHFQRFQGQSDTSSSRIPHSSKGRPRAQDLLNMITFHLLPECDPPIHYLSTPNPSLFHLF